MEGQEILLEIIEDHIALVTFNRPEVRNAMNRKVTAMLSEVLDRLEKDDEARVVIFKGAGTEAFSAGHDLKELVSASTWERSQEFLVTGKLIERITNFPKPTIAAVQGYCMGGGVWLANSCDIVIASEDAVFALPQLNVGIFPMVPMVSLVRSVGRHRALELIYTSDRVDARKAEMIGLVNQVVPSERLEETALALARKIASKSPIALRMGKEAAVLAADMEFGKALRSLAYAMTGLAISEDAEEGLKALMEKRQPQWKGR